VPFPGVAEELALHQRVVAGDPVASADVFQAFMDPITEALCRDLQCSEDDAHDSGIDAVLEYVEQPTRFSSGKGRLSTYLMDIAKKRAIDRIRSSSSRQRRDEGYAAVVELQAANPKETMEVAIEAKELWLKVEAAVPDERDRQAIGLILSGERSADAFAEVIGVTAASPLEVRRLVKQQRDRLVKVLERLGARMSDDDDA
jgi:RNA polymerase sigma-70 factor (ECF subfamily)